MAGTYLAAKALNGFSTNVCKLISRSRRLRRRTGRFSKPTTIHS